MPGRCSWLPVSGHTRACPPETRSGPATPRVFELLRDRLNHPGLILAPAAHALPTAMDAIRRFTRVEPTRTGSGGLVYDGLILAVAGVGRASWDIYFRPARHRPGPHASLLREAMVYFDRDFGQLDWLRGDDCARMMARIADDPLLEGAYEVDPRCSAPHVVAATRDALALGDDAATLYLQLLAVLSPTDRNIRTCNNWKTPRHRAAEDELLTRGLVVRGKRPRTRRTVFLPGPWIPVPGVESWKEPMHQLYLEHRGKQEQIGLPCMTRPLPELFEQALHRVTHGDPPA